MENLRIMDVRLRGCAFTLYPAAEKFNVDGDLMREIVAVMNFKLGIITKCGLMSEEGYGIEKENPNMPLVLTKNDFALYSESLESIIQTGLVTEEGEMYKVTDKALEVLHEAAKRQNDLDESGFSFCPCHQC